MYADDLTSSVLAQLRRPRPYPAVTLAMPTHRLEPDNAQDTVRLRNLVAEAERRLDADPDVTRAARIDVAEQLREAAASAELRYAQNGMVILAAAGEHQVWYLPRHIPERIVLSDTFLTRNLVSAHELSRPYWVLAVSAARTTLWGGAVAGALHEHRDDGFPAEPDTADLDEAAGETLMRVGDFPGIFDAQTTRQYLRGVHIAMHELLARDERPVYLVGAEEALSAFDEEAVRGRLDTERVAKGGLTDGPATALGAALERALREADDAFVRRAMGRLEGAANGRRQAAGLDDVWNLAQDARISELLVEENYRTRARLVEDRLMPLDDGTPVGAGGEAERTDVVDEIIESVLDTGGSMAFVPDDMLSGYQRIAAVVRY